MHYSNSVFPLVTAEPDAFNPREHNWAEIPTVCPRFHEDHVWQQRQLPTMGYRGSGLSWYYPGVKDGEGEGIGKPAPQRPVPVKAQEIICFLLIHKAGSLIVWWSCFSGYLHLPAVLFRRRRSWALTELTAIYLSLPQSIRNYFHSQFYHSCWYIIVEAVCLHWANIENCYFISYFYTILSRM